MKIKHSEWQTDPLGHWPDVGDHDIRLTMGYIPSFLKEHDRPAAQQIAEEYTGGWHPLPAWKMADNGVVTYPGDLPLWPAALLEKQDGEIVRFYPGARVSITQPNGDFEVALID